jgi:5-methylcytosine-specific restriction endonuclease McrA
MDKRLLKIAYRNKLKKLSNNQIAIVFKAQSSNFINSKEWRELRQKALKQYGANCVFCGSDKNINIDHILPRKFYPELALDIKNLQPLCAKCNKRKGNSVKTTLGKLPIK